jgi:hypothetical protein
MFAGCIPADVFSLRSRTVDFFYHTGEWSGHLRQVIGGKDDYKAIMDPLRKLSAKETMEHYRKSGCVLC